MNLLSRYSIYVIIGGDIMENLLTENDLLVFQACTGQIVCKDFDKVRKFIEQTLGRVIQTAELGLQHTYNECMLKLKDRYFVVLDKMNNQTTEAA